MRQLTEPKPLPNFVSAVSSLYANASWRLRFVHVLLLIGVIVGITGSTLSSQLDNIIIFDNIHWTCAYTLAAMISWLSPRTAT